jgi:hypothetical protein
LKLLLSGVSDGHGGWRLQIDSKKRLVFEDLPVQAPKPDFIEELTKSKSWGGHGIAPIGPLVAAMTRCGHLPYPEGT